MSYLTYSFNLTENQKKKLANAYNNKEAVNIKFKFNQLTVSSNYDNIKTTKENR